VHSSLFPFGFSCTSRSTEGRYKLKSFKQPKLGNRFQVGRCEHIFDARHGVKKCQIWHHINQCLDYPMPCLALFFVAHVWRQKASKLDACNHLHNYGILPFSCSPYYLCKQKVQPPTHSPFGIFRRRPKI